MKGSIGTSTTLHSCMTKERLIATTHNKNQKKKKASICLSCKSNIEGYCKKYACKCYIASNECENTSHLKLLPLVVETRKPWIKKAKKKKKKKNKTSKKK